MFAEVEATSKKPREITAKQALYLVDLGMSTSEIRRLNFNEARGHISHLIEEKKKSRSYMPGPGYRPFNGSFRDNYQKEDYDDGDYEY